MNRSTSRREPLRVLSWGGRWGRALGETVVRPFEEQTGEEVRVVPQVGLGIPDSLRSALTTGGRPPFDVVWSGISAAIHAAEAGHTVPLDGLRGLDQLRRRAAPEGLDGWPFVHPYVVYYVLVYARGGSHPAPRSWSDLIDGRYRRRVGLYPRGNGFFPVAQLLGGGAVEDIPSAMAPCWRGLHRMREQIGFLDYSPALVEPLRRGDVTLAFRTLPNALGFRDDGLDVEWVAPVEGVPDTVDAFWIPRGLDEATIARAAAFIEFALSAPVQARWCASLGTMPVHPDVGRPDIMNGTNLPMHADERSPLYVSELVKHRHQAEWEFEFERVVGNERP